MSRFKLKSDSSNLLNENSASEPASKHKDAKPLYSMASDNEKCLLVEVDKLRKALTVAIGENDEVQID